MADIAFIAGAVTGIFLLSSLVRGNMQRIKPKSRHSRINPSTASYLAPLLNIKVTIFRNR